MQCLRSEYSSEFPDAEASVAEPWRKKWKPLPDFIEGSILEIEHIHLTPDKRERLRFLSHLPLYTDISFVELNISKLLSSATKKKFAKDFQRRRNVRKKQLETERREDARVRRIEEARINELKARMQRIDPNDEFFQVHVAEAQSIDDCEEFGPALTGEESLSPRSPCLAPVDNPVVSFSQITREGGKFPSISSNDQTAFPALGSSPLSRRSTPTPAPWKAITKTTTGSPSTPNIPVSAGKKKKGGGKKIVLFSTGGHRDVGKY
jgi:hypothetical protein